MSYKDIKPETASPSKIIQRALCIAKDWCDVPGKFYSQQSRWGPSSTDCSGLMFRVWQQCYDDLPTLWQKGGINQGVIQYANAHTGGSKYTGTMYQVFTACGFQVLDSEIMRSTNPTGLQPGDILLNSYPYLSAHTAMVYGRDDGGQLWLVEAGGNTTKAGGAGPSAYNGVGFSKYWGKGYWQYAFRCPLGYEDSFKMLKKLQAEWYVGRIYRTLLKRESDPEGLNTYTVQLYNVETEKREYSIYYVLASFLGSDEYLKIAYTNEQFITQLYKLILGREPDPDGLNNFITILNNNPKTVTITISGTAKTISTRSYILWELCRSGEANPKDSSITNHDIYKEPRGTISRLYGGLIMITKEEAAGVDERLQIDMTPKVSLSTSSCYYKIDGEWKKAKQVYTKVNDEWKLGKKIYAKDPSDVTLEWFGN